MKSLNMYLGSVIDNDDLHFESLLDDEDIFLNPENDKKVIEEWIKNNYKFTGKLTISDDLVVDCNDNVKVKNKSITSLTNGLFRWGKINKIFDCGGCNNLKSLEGAPEEVGRDFDCSGCNNLKSLVGAPKEVGRDFDCGSCKNLTSLEGAPEWVGGNFICVMCNNLTSLKGAPKEVGGYFTCENCDNLTSLEGAPEWVGWDFYCGDCKKLKITDSDRKKYRIVEY